uniref:Uncharacterized protein n=1 Tax=Caenorhabditis japonica TaxID=281687 RepID=A0A8R1EQL3_CAEJA
MSRLRNVRLRNVRLRNVSAAKRPAAKYCCKWPERTMGVIGLTAVEVLAFCLGFGLLLAVLIVICNCVSTCWEMLSHRRKKQRVERLPDNYVDEIHRLLHRNQKACEYDCVVIESRRQSANLE